MALATSAFRDGTCVEPPCGSHGHDTTGGSGTLTGALTDVSSNSTVGCSFDVSVQCAEVPAKPLKRTSGITTVETETTVAMKEKG
jgi:hypothetical protein